MSEAFNKSTVERTFNGLESLEGEEDLRVLVRLGNCAEGDPRDPANCAIARAARRVFGSDQALINRTVAYIDHPGSDGETRVYRYILGADAKKLVSDFDKGRLKPGNYWVTLRAPQGCYTRDAARDRSASYHERKTAVMRGELVDHRIGSRPDIKNRVDDFELRNGTGLVQVMSSGASA